MSLQSYYSENALYSEGGQELKSTTDCMAESPHFAWLESEHMFNMALML